MQEEEDAVAAGAVAAEAVHREAAPVQRRKAPVRQVR